MCHDLSHSADFCLKILKFELDLEKFTSRIQPLQVLGTIITEWKDGEGLCDEFLADDETSIKFAIKCAEMARDVGFEGWLLNIENHLKEELVPRMKNFVRRLTEEMHKLVPGSLVIWCVGF